MTDTDVETVFANAVYDRLAGDATLTALLATYTNGAGATSPAIFLHPPVPPRAARPWVVFQGFSSGTNWDTKDRNGFDVEGDILAIADADGTTRIVGPIASRVQSLLHKFYLDVSGYQTLIAFAGPPLIAPTDETLVGRLIHGRWILRALPS